MFAILLSLCMYTIVYGCFSCVLYGILSLSVFPCWTLILVMLSLWSRPSLSLLICLRRKAEEKKRFAAVVGEKDDDDDGEEEKEKEEGEE